MKPLVSRSFGSAIDRNFEIAHQQPVIEIARARIDDIHVNVRVHGPHLRNAFDKMVWRDGAHQSQSKLDALHARELARALQCLHRLLIDPVQVGLDDARELGEVGIRTLPVEQEPAKFPLEVGNRSCQGRLRNIAARGRTCEIQLLAHRSEVANLMHPHDGLGGLREQSTDQLERTLPSQDRNISRRGICAMQIDGRGNAATRIQHVSCGLDIVGMVSAFEG